MSTKKPELTSFDDFMRGYLSQREQQDTVRRANANAAAWQGADSAEDYEAQIQKQAAEHNQQVNAALAAEQYLRDSQNKTVGQHLRDAGSAVMGTMASMGSVVDLGVSAAAQGLSELTGLDQAPEGTSYIGDSLERMNDRSEYWQSLKSHKAQAHRRLVDYRTSQQDGLLDEAGAAVGAYLDSPENMLSEAVGQLPYILTGGVAKGVTTATKVGQAAVSRLVTRGMSQEAAEKAVMMGLTGLQQGAVEGSDAASGAYMRVMGAENTQFASDEERQGAALSAALEAGLLAGVTSAVTGTIASKWELSPFTATGSTAARRVGDNIFKALQEGVQEIAESGMGQYAPNIAGNRVLSEEDQVDPLEGVGGAMGEGFVLGTAGAGITSAPSTAKNVIGAGLGITGSAIGALGGKALTKEQAERNQGFDIQAAEVAQGIQNTSAGQTLAAADEATQSDPLIPDEYKGTVYSAYLKAAHALRNPAKGQTEEHKLKALTTVLKAVDHLTNTGAQLQQDIDAETDPARKAELQTQLDKIENHLSEADLTKWLEKFPANESVAEKLDKAFETPEAYSAAVSLITSLNPVHLPKAVIEKALAQKGLEPEVRSQLQFSLALHEAVERVSVAGTNKSMMETGFPEMGGISVRDMVGKVAEAVKLGAPVEAQKHFGKLAAFAADRQKKAAAFLNALNTLRATPGQDRALVEGYDRKLESDGNGGQKLVKGESWVMDKPGTVKLIDQMQQEASAITQMAQAVAQQYGLTSAHQTAPVQASVAPVASAAPAPTPNQEKPAETRTEAPKARKTPKHKNPVDMTDDEIASELSSLKRNSARKEDLQREQDIRTAEGMSSRPDTPQAAQEAPQKAPEPESTETAPKEEKASQSQPESEVAESEVKEEAEAQPEPTTQTADEAADANEGPVNPKNNHSTGLRSEYPVAEDASEAEKEQAKNHLVHSFTSTQEGGLSEQQGDALYTDEALTDFLLLDTKDMTEEEIQEDLTWSKKTAGKILDTVQSIENTLQDLMWRFPTSLLKGKNPWANNYARSLYATVTNKQGKLQYQEGIARVMAWTGLQAISEIATPVEWDDTAIDNFSKAYGSKAAQMLAQGWVPMATAVGTVSRLLQTNLGLQAKDSVSSTYTEGTMSSLASDIVTALIVQDPRFKKGKDAEANNAMLEGGDLQIQQLTGTIDGKEVTSTWVRSNLPGKVLAEHFNTMQHLREFFPERTRNVAYNVGTAPTRVNKKYRGSQQSISAQQEKALKKRNETWHRISPVLYQVFKKLDQNQFLKLFGHNAFVEPEDGAALTYHQLQLQGQARTHEHDDAVIRGHIDAVERAAKETGLGIHEINSYFEYEMVVSGRAMTKGTSPQSSTKYREIFANVQRQVNPADGPAKNAGFMMAVAQGLGIKMDKQPIKVSLEKLAQEVETDRFKGALEAANVLLDPKSTKDAVDAALDTINESGYNSSSHGVAALLHYAQYQKGEEFTSTIAYEIDGATDGPINLFMLMGMQKDRTKLAPWLKLAGLFLSSEQKALQDYVGEIEAELGAKDLYGVVSNEIKKATTSLRNLYTQTATGSEVTNYLSASDRLAVKLGMLTTLKDREGNALTGPENLLVARDIIKTPTQAGGYGQSSFAARIAYTKAMLEKVSELMAAGQWTEQDQKDLEFITGNRVVHSSKTNRTFLAQEDSRDIPYEVNLKGWKGTPLDNWEILEITDALSGFHAKAFADGIETALGAQLQNMNAAREAINHVVRFAQIKLQEAYEAERAKLVSEGKLLEKQPLPPAVERRIAKEVWDKYVPHPAFRTMAGMPVGRLERTLNVGLDRVSGTLFNQAVYGTTFKDSQNNLTERSLAEPGKSFSASSIIGSGDGAMMTDFFSTTTDNVQDMYDGAYLDPTLIDQIGAQINGGVFRNWNFDFIGKILETIPIQNPEFVEYLKNTPYKTVKVKGAKVTLSAYTQVGEALSMLAAQRDTNRENWGWIKGQTSWTSHMAGHNNPHKNEAGTDTAFEGEFAYTLTYANDGVNIANIEPTTPTVEDPGASVDVPVTTLDREGIIQKMQSHTWKNQLALGVWNRLVPLLSNDLTIMMFDDAESLTKHFNETTGKDVPVSNGLYYKNQIWSIKKENTLVHEAFHSVFTNILFDWGLWKNGEAPRPSYLTKKQEIALNAIEKLMHEFQSITTEDTPPWVSDDSLSNVQGHITTFLGQKDIAGAMDEFLAYALTDKNLQEILRIKRSTLGDLIRKVFDAIKSFMGMPDGTQSDSMLAHILSNFQQLADDVQVPPPSSVDLETVRFQTQPEIGFSIKGVLETLEAAAVHHPNPELRDPLLVASKTAPDKGRERIAQLSESGFFNFSPETQAAAEYLQAMFFTGLNLNPAESSVLGKLADQIREAGPALWVTANDPTGEDRYNYIFERNADNNLAADLLSLALVDEDFNKNLTELKMDQKMLDKSNLSKLAVSTVDMLYQAFDHKGDIKKGSSVADAYKAMALRIRQSNVKYAETIMRRPSFYQKLQDGVADALSKAGDSLGKMGQKALADNNKQVGTLLVGLAAIASDNYADALGKGVLHLTNQIDGHDFIRGLINETVGTNSSNRKLIRAKMLSDHVVSALRQSLVEQVPAEVKSWFKDLNEGQDALLHRGIGETGLYLMSQDNKDRLGEILDDTSGAILDAQVQLMSRGDSKKRLAMIRHAKALGDRMAGKTAFTPYSNTQAIADLALDGGKDSMNKADMEALEDLSTLQALSHMTRTERQNLKRILEEQPDAFWKSAVLMHSIYEYDVNNAGGQGDATLNFRKGYMPVEADTRRKVKIFSKNQVQKAQNQGWTVVGDFDQFHVYMATTTGNPPTLSSGAIQATDYHLGGVHFRSGSAIDNSVSTMITNPREVQKIYDLFTKGKAELPYTVVYDHDGVVKGFQRIMDQEIVNKHTRATKSLSKAAGMHIGRLHEQKMARELNDAAVLILWNTYDDEYKDDPKAFVNVTAEDAPAYAKRVWDTLPHHTKKSFENYFGKGNVMIRKDQLYDALGYHKASVTDIFNNTSTFDRDFEDRMAAALRSVFKGNTYKYLAQAESAWQGAVGVAKDTIIVKSGTVAAVNLASNQTQLAMVTGNPVWNLAAQSRAHKELKMHLDLERRMSRLRAQEMSTLDPVKKKSLNIQIDQMRKSQKTLRISKLVEAGEMPVIAEGISQVDRYNLANDGMAWIEEKVDKMPNSAKKVMDFATISKESPLYQGMNAMVQYGDFVAKAAMYEWLTTKKGMTHEQAITEVNDEFVNYSRLPGRARTYLEDIGLAWFWNYKLRIMKIIARRFRKNPLGFLMFNVGGDIANVDPIWNQVPWVKDWAYSMGPEMMFRAPSMLMWNNLFGALK